MFLVNHNKLARADGGALKRMNALMLFLALLNEGPLPATKLATYATGSTGGFYRLLGVLAGSGLITRTRVSEPLSDQRFVLVDLTEAGRALITEVCELVDLTLPKRQKGARLS